MDTMETLYEWIKDSLKFFNLSWGEKDQVEIEIKDDTLIMRFEGKTVSYTPPRRE